MRERNPIVFFAIPCGDFYSVQAEIIEKISKIAKIHPIIAEDELRTKGLWDKIAEQIDSADLFVADISSGSANIIFELGYAIREKSLKNIGIFTSKVAPKPSDLNGFLRQEYSSFSEFQKRLIEWLCESIPLLNPEAFEELELNRIGFNEDFKDQDQFSRRWSIPPGGSYLLMHEGLRFSNTHLPILTTPLAIMRDCVFEFRARIEQGKLGWVVKGTKDPTSFYPSFCLMFNMSDEGEITPHILNQKTLNKSSDYHVFSEKSKKIELEKSKDGWFTIKTKVKGDIVEIEHEAKVVFSVDFQKEPFNEIYGCFPDKEGQIGFRCYPNEEATINYVKVNEL